MEDSPDIVAIVSRCEIESMHRAGKTLNPSDPDSCLTFRNHVQGLQAVVIYRFKVTAIKALSLPDPGEAAELWESMSKLCASALSEISQWTQVYPNCGTPELYDMVLDYKSVCDQRAAENREDAECLKTPPPKGLFPILNW